MDESLLKCTYRIHADIELGQMALLSVVSSYKYEEFSPRYVSKKG